MHNATASVFSFMYSGMERFLPFLICLAVVGLVPYVTSYSTEDKIAQSACAAVSATNYEAYSIRRECYKDQKRDCKAICNNLGTTYPAFETSSAV